MACVVVFAEVADNFEGRGREGEASCGDVEVKGAGCVLVVAMRNSEGGYGGHEAEY